MAAQQPPHYRPGDVVNGHVLSANGQWVPIATSGSPPGGTYPPPPGYQQPAPEGTAPHYRPGDVVNGYVLNTSYQWEPAVRHDADTVDSDRGPPAVVAIGSGVLGLSPLAGLTFIGWIFAIIAVTLGAQTLSRRSAEDKGDLVVGTIAVALGTVGIVGAVIQYIGI